VPQNNKLNLVGPTPVEQTASDGAEWPGLRTEFAHSRSLGGA
jgi:hypothetical protein